LDMFADADFAGNWLKSTAPYDVGTAKSRTGYVLTFADCPITWASKLQTLIALSTCEAEFVSLSEGLRCAIPVMNLIKELKGRAVDIVSTAPRVHCRAFEDNSGALELARLPKMRPRTKHINLVYHHFKDFVRRGLVSIYPITSANQCADLFTKPLPQNDFLRHRRTLLKW